LIWSAPIGPPRPLSSRESRGHPGSPAVVVIRPLIKLLNVFPPPRGQVLSSKLMPTTDDEMAKTSVKSFCENFLKAGGLR